LSFSLSDFVNKVDAKLPEKITIIDTDENKYILQALTLDIYNKYVKERVCGKLEFKSDEEVQNFYKELNF
jgi:hypothetical protein